MKLLFRKSRFGIIGKRNWTDEDIDEFIINKTQNNPHIYIQLDFHNYMIYCITLECLNKPEQLIKEGDIEFDLLKLLNTS